MAVVRIEVDSLTAKVFSPYAPERVEVIKSIPGRQWSGDGKFWRIPVTQVPALKVALEVIGDQVVIVGQTEQPPRQSGDDGEARRLRAENTRLERENGRLRQEAQRLRNEAAARKSNWAETLLSKLGPEQAERAYKRLASVLHPDVGGPDELMRDLNVAHDLLGSRGWR